MNIYCFTCSIAFHSLYEISLDFIIKSRYKTDIDSISSSLVNMSGTLFTLIYACIDLWTLCIVIVCSWETWKTPRDLSIWSSWGMNSHDAHVFQLQLLTMKSSNGNINNNKPGLLFFTFLRCERWWWWWLRRDGDVDDVVWLEVLQCC